MSSEMCRPTTAAPRPPAVVMDPQRLAALQPTRLSFARSLTQKMIRETWTITRPEFDIDADGAGSARYHVETGDDSFEFVLFSYRPNPEQRTDRIIGRHWDMMGALIEGSAGKDRIAHTRRELPKLYGGRAAPGTLVWCRSNRSMRAFDLTVDSLAAGVQPPADVLASVCYLMRNTGLDGNGTFGTRSFLDFEDDHPLKSPLHAQMLAAYLMREFSIDLAEHIAAQRSADAVSLDPAMRRFLGLGNASGLGLILFAKNHAALLDRWLDARERALAHARSQVVSSDGPAIARFEDMLARVIRFRAEDRMRYTYLPEGKLVADELAQVDEHLQVLRGRGTTVSLDELFTFAERTTGLEAQECVNGLLIDLDDEHTDSLATTLIGDESTRTAPAMSVGDLLAQVEDEYDWALEMDLTAADARAFAWYKSANAEEPRRGPLSELPAGFDDLTLDVPADVQALAADLSATPPDTTVAAFLATHSQHRSAVERIQTLTGRQYATVRANLRAAEFNPSWVIRLFNSALHGLDKTKEDGPVGVVGVMFHGAPTRDDLASGALSEWTHPAEPGDLS